MRAAVVGILLVVLVAAPAGAQLIPTTTEPPSPPSTTEAPTTTEAPPVTEAPPPETTAPPETRAPRPTEPPAEATTTAPPDTTPGFVPPEGRPQTPEVLEGPEDPKTGKLPLFVALSLGGIGAAAVIVGAQAVATRPGARRRPAPRSGPPV